MKKFDFNVSLEYSSQFDADIKSLVVIVSVFARCAQDTLVLLYYIEDNFDLDDESLSDLIEEYEDFTIKMYDLLGDIGEFLEDFYGFPKG